MRILYVEDNEANASLVQRIAKMGNHEFFNYIDAETALQHFNAIDPDVVLVDVQLAGEMNGIELVRRLRSVGCDLPIIILTAFATDGERSTYLELGCDEFIVKPASVNQLIDLIAAV